MITAISQSTEKQAVILTPVEAAKILGASRQTLANWRLQRRGPKYFSVGTRFIRYKLADLEAWMAEHTIDPNA